MHRILTKKQKKKKKKKEGKKTADFLHLCVTIELQTSS